MPEASFKPSMEHMHITCSITFIRVFARIMIMRKKKQAWAEKHEPLPKLSHMVTIES